MSLIFGSARLNDVNIRSLSYIILFSIEPAPSSGPQLLAVSQPRGQVLFGLYTLSRKFQSLFRIPCLGRYDVKAKKVSGLIGRFSEAKPKTDIDLAQHRASEQPGPASYNPSHPSFAVSGGGTFNQVFLIKYAIS